MAFDNISGIFQGDLVIKASIELALDDIRKDNWVIDDIFASLLENPILARKYGAKEIARAKEFLLNNKIPIYLAHRVDKQDFPCITISIGNSQEDTSLSTMANQTPIVEEYLPSDVMRTIKYIIPPFNPVSFDSATGILEIPSNIAEYEYVFPGMILMDPNTGGGYEIIEKKAPSSIKIQPGAKVAKEVGIIPKYQTLRARRERAISQESYNIGCHVHGDPSTLIFLYSFVKYALFRYREGLIEASNFQLSRLSSTDLIKNTAFNIENVYSRWITLSGQAEETWIKSPMRIIEGAILKDSSSTTGLTQGIKYLTNEVTPNSQDPDQIWTTTVDKPKK